MGGGQKQKRLLSKAVGLVFSYLHWKTVSYHYFNEKLKDINRTKKLPLHYRILYLRRLAVDGRELV